MLEDVRLFDVYQGKQVAAGSRSLAYALRFRSPEATLTDEQADAICRRIVERMGTLGGTLRT